MVEHEKVIGPTQEEIAEINDRVKPASEEIKPPAKLKIGRRLAGGVLALGLLTGACSPQETQPPQTISVEKTPEPSPTPDLTVTPSEEINPTETVEPQPTIQAEGPVIEGQSLNLGGAEMPLVERDGTEIAKKIGANERDWQVVTNEQGKANAFIGQETVILPQGPAGYEWDQEAGVWMKGNKGVISDVVIPGRFDQEKGVGGPLATPDTAVLVKEEDAFKAVILYDQETVKAVGMDFSQENLTELSGGGAMFVSDEVNKSFNLNEGESIQRNPETGALEITNQEGQIIRRMELRWSRVKTPEEAENLGKWVKVQQEIQEPTETPEAERISGQWGNIKVTFNPEVAKRAGIKEVRLNTEQFPDAEERLQRALDLGLALGFVKEGDWFVKTGPFIDSGVDYDLDETAILEFRREMREKGLSGVEGAMELIKEKRANGEPILYPIIKAPKENETVLVDVSKPVEIEFVANAHEAPAKFQDIPYDSYGWFKREDGGLKITNYSPSINEEDAFITRIPKAIMLTSSTEAQIGHYNLIEGKLSEEGTRTREILDLFLKKREEEENKYVLGVFLIDLVFEN